MRSTSREQARSFDFAQDDTLGACYEIAWKTAFYCLKSFELRPIRVHPRNSRAASFLVSPVWQALPNSQRYPRSRG